MPSTHVSLCVHIIFATKNRHPYFSPDDLPRLHEYLGGIIGGLGGIPLAVGGVGDHVHLLIGLRATHTVSDLVREIKKSSSSWIRDTLRTPDFAWQEGYAVFSVSPERREGVRKYIERQAEHHGTRSSLEELEELLRFAGVDFNPRYFD